MENKVNEGQEKVKIKINNFRLTFNRLDFNAVINDDSYMNVSGDLAILKKSVNLVLWYQDKWFIDFEKFNKSRV